MKKRIKKLITAAAILLAAGILYYVINRLTGFAIPCPFHLLTGFYCPGCGISRMFISLFQLDFITAFHQNAGVLILSPLLIILAVVSIISYIKTGNMPNSRWFNILAIFLICCFVLFGVLRNIPYFSFLAPIGSF